KHAEIARANIAHADLSSAAEVRVGRAQETLPRLLADHRGPFDFIFIDADNVVRKGGVADPASTDANVQGVQRFHQAVAAERRVTATTMQTVGAKGYDGFTIIYVNS